MKTNLIEEKYEFPFTQQDFEALRGLVTGHTGIELPDNKKTLMYTRLVRRLRQLQLPDFAAYTRHVKAELSGGKQEELMLMVNAMTTNVTAFFREPHHFDHLAETLPELVRLFGPKLRIWTCASSSGQEPWTIAMVCAEFMAKNSGVDIKIDATDLDANMVHTAEAGLYALPPDEVRSHPLMKKYLEPAQPAPQAPKAMMGQELYSVAHMLRPMLRYRTLNLLAPNWPLPESRYHVVFCRNVIIYFSKDTQRKIFNRVAPMMPPGAALYIGHSESLLNVSNEFTSVGRTAYRRNNPQPQR